MSTTLQHNDYVLGKLLILNEKGRLAHAYLFSGPDGVGKVQTAYALAKSLNCLQKSQGEAFCGECSLCRKIDARSHPDVHFVEARQEEAFKIDQIREVLSQSRLFPFEAAKKVFILKNAQNLTPEAANALLKTLEEPNASSLFILTTASRENVLPTIASRCHHFSFAGLTQEELEAALLKSGIPQSGESHFLGLCAEGSLGKALKLKESGLFQEKNGYIDGFIYASNVDAFLKNVLAEKTEAKMFLDVLLNWVRDAILLKTGISKDRLVHLDRVKQLEQFQARYSLEDLSMMKKEIVQSIQLLADNFNIKIPLLIIKERLRNG